MFSYNSTKNNIKNHLNSSCHQNIKNGFLLSLCIHLGIKIGQAEENVSYNLEVLHISISER